MRLLLNPKSNPTSMLNYMHTLSQTIAASTWSIRLDLGLAVRLNLGIGLRLLETVMLIVDVLTVNKLIEYLIQETFFFKIRVCHIISE